MKKFDLFLLIIACGLISFGFYFSKHFKSDVDLEVKTHGKQMHGSVNHSKRTPSQTSDLKTNNSESTKNKIDTKEEISSEKKYINEYKHLQKCIITQDCDFPQDDPRSYELAIYQKMNEHLQNIDNVSNSIKEKILMSAAKYSDGYVKETVLHKIMQDKMYSKQWMHIILDEYIAHHNARLIPDAIKYLKEHSSDSERGFIHQRIFSEIANGSPKVANALADNIKILLDEKSYSFYKSQISNLEEGPIRSNLNRELRDYELMSSAG